MPGNTVLSVDKPVLEKTDLQRQLMEKLAGMIFLTAASQLLGLLGLGKNPR